MHKGVDNIFGEGGGGIGSDEGRGEGGEEEGREGGRGAGRRDGLSTAHFAPKFLPICHTHF
jgi:hypothetical protein